MGLAGFDIRAPLAYVTGSVYFLLMILICYSGHISWNLGLGYVVEFVLVWAFVGWFSGVLIYMSQEKLTAIFGFHEGIFETFYAVWGKTITVFVRPISLRLRLLINLSAGHASMALVIFWSEVYSSLLTQSILSVIVVYELFVFFLQSFIFSRLLSIYLEEVCCLSIISMIVLSAIGFR